MPRLRALAVGKLIDLQGKTFGRLTVLERSHPVFLNLSSGHRETWWLCRCECGNKVEVRSKSLRDGDTTSCGCVHSEITARRSSRGASKIRVFPDCAEIELCDREGRAVAAAIIDKGDLGAVSGVRWYKSNRGYAARSDSDVYLHSILLPDAAIVCFKDGNKLNCRRSNLRPCTASQSAANAKKRPGASGFRGVSYQARSKRWYASVYVNKKRVRLGGYESPEQAALAYNEAALKYHGEFAILNDTGPLRLEKSNDDSDKTATH